ncbi:hypothetical protein PTKIN_Ptkin05aG0141000 [Pterospermum kingtungense]
MAASPSSSSSKTKTKTKKKGSNTITNTNTKTKSTRSTDSGCSSTHPPLCPKRSRNKSPGIRLVHGRIYDSQNGKTCHQCRQKTVDFAASCKKNFKEKQCTIHYCHKCLLNRYGEKAEEVALLNDWICPRCRGICNCSFCMKKRGHQPTGILVHAAKANGFASVSDMLHLKDSECSRSQETIDVAVNSKKRKAAEKESGVKETGDSRKGGCFEGPNGSMQDDDRTATRNTRLTRSRNKNAKEIASRGIDADFSTQKISPKKTKILKEASFKGEVICDRNGAIQLLDMKVPNRYNHGEHEVLKSADSLARNKPTSRSPNHKKKNVKVKTKASDAEILLPQGILLNFIAGIDLPVEDVGHALQFLEFCEAFGEVLKMRKGQSELLLRELVTGQSERRLRHSSVVQFHIQLLSVMQKDSGKEYPCLNQNLSENFWLQVLREYICDSQYLLKQPLLECLDVGDDGYEQLDSSKKLRLLNFLCDEVLGTIDFRTWIDEQNSKFVEKEKESKKELLAQREKERNLEKEMKKKLQDEIAKAILMKNGAPLSISENEDLVSRIKSEVAQTLEVAHTLASSLEVSETVIAEDWRSDAVRSETIFWDGHDHKFHKFWRLRGYSGETDILLQDIEGVDLVTAKERWYTYGNEQKAIVEKYISSFRMPRK